MIRLFFALSLLSFCMSQVGSAQEESENDAAFDSFSEIERLLEGRTQDEEEIELADLVGRFGQQPLDLNEARVKELELLPGITPFLAREIVLQRRRSSGFRSVYDLLSVPGMSFEIFRSIESFVVVHEDPVRRVSPRSFLGRVSIRARIRSSHDLQKKRGFHDGTYHGSRQKVYQRLLVSTRGLFEAGLLLEKDPGERKLDDFLSGYVQLRRIAGFSTLLIGDFQIDAGQGLLLSRVSHFSKGGDPITGPKKSPRGLLPYRSVEENRFFRGVAGNFEVGKFEITGFYSRNRLDANVKDDSIVSFPGTGYHRTENELIHKRAAGEIAVGGRAVYRFNEQSYLGLTGFSATFDKPVVHDQQLGNSRLGESVFGVDYSITEKTVNVFGEWIGSRNGGFGGVCGVILGLEPMVAASLLYQLNPKMLLSDHGVEVRRSTRETKNAWDLYFGLRVRPTNSVILSAFSDLFRSRRTGSRNPFPSWGHDAFLQGEIHLRRYIRVSARFGSKLQVMTQPAIDDQGRESRILVERSKRNLRLTFVYEVGKQLAIRSRAEFVGISAAGGSANKSGMLLYHEVKYWHHQQVTLAARVIFFATDSFDSRVYEFENDVLGTFANPALFGRGRRWYLLVRYKVTGFLQVSTKYVETYRDDVKTIGSGPDQILGNVQSRLNIQLDVSL